MRLKFLFFILAFVAGHWSLGGDAWARKWKPTPLESARDYLTIEHGLSNRDAVMIIWMAPEYFKDVDENKIARKLVQEYMIVAVAHFSVNIFLEWKFENPAEVTVDLGNSESLTPLPQESLPPLVAATIELLRKTMADGFGRMGEGMKFFVYDGKRVDSCAEGVLWVNYLSERYEYQTPLPGCE